tara:strand:+ start:885 stop:1139 length:255 start_codon:yes stop_codon:yes gene_type:complete
MQYYNGQKINYHSITIEPDGSSFDVYGHSFYPASSVLAGQQMKSSLANYETIEEAKKDFPKAEVLDFRTQVHNYYDHLPDDSDY